jgi:putative PEP-CTERM system histidine kinase
MPIWVNATTLLHGFCCAVYLALAGLILGQARRSRTGVLLAGASLVTAAWAAAIALGFIPGVALVAGILDLVRPAIWAMFILHLYRAAVLGSGRRVGATLQAIVLAGLLLVVVISVLLSLGQGNQETAVALWSVWVVGRLVLAICTLLLIENLYFNTPAESRWHINLPSVALGALSIYDIALSGDALLFRQLSAPLYEGRAIATAIVAPLLAIAAVRNRTRWDVAIHVSRSAVFHSATLVISGIFLLGLVAAGETFRYFGTNWGGVAEISLIFAGVVTIAVMMTSRTARSHLRGLLVDHFFTHRYDYRREWERCIATLSSPGAYVALHTRVIRTVAEIIDSPAGVLFLREHEGAPLQWAGSLNMPAATAPVMADHPLIAAFREADWIVDLATLPPEHDIIVETGIGRAWLAVPLNHNGRLTGCILAAPPRAAFKLDREVFDLLRMLGRQVGTYVAEQRATEVLLQTRQLHEYSKRFAFVAHDIKNVSSQLSLLLSNAEVHLENPEFQRDMLATIRSAVQKISALIKRLQTPDSEFSQAVIMPAERLEAIVAGNPRLRAAKVTFTEDDRSAGVAMSPAAFDAVVGHLLNNAVEASTTQGSAEPVTITLRHEARRALIDITDHGPGMTPEFIRDDLFRPFRTSKPEGSGIGAYQARELLREAGGDLLVISRPGAGTTMRLLLPLVEGMRGKEDEGPLSPGLPPRAVPLETMTEGFEERVPTVPIATSSEAPSLQNP